MVLDSACTKSSAVGSDSIRRIGKYKVKLVCVESRKNSEEIAPPDENIRGHLSLWLPLDKLGGEGFFLFLVDEVERFRRIASLRDRWVMQVLRDDTRLPDCFTDMIVLSAGGICVPLCSEDFARGLRGGLLWIFCQAKLVDFGESLHAVLPLQFFAEDVLIQLDSLQVGRRKIII